MPQDSTQINNANLIEDLNPGLYVIDKAYQDGSNSQSVILKENNWYLFCPSMIWYKFLLNREFQQYPRKDYLYTKRLWESLKR